MKGKIVAVCLSQKKGTPKEPQPYILLKENHGVLGDAHAGSDTPRQVSLLGIESIERVSGVGWYPDPGDFAENLTTQGIELPSLPLGTKLLIGNSVILEITQIGKECHTGCAIYRRVGNCIMPQEGVFAKVIRGGIVKPDDPVVVVWWR